MPYWILFPPLVVTVAVIGITAFLAGAFAIHSWLSHLPHPPVRTAGAH